MKCLILVGGYGTRLRPLTLSAPKPLVPFCNLPIVEHQIAAAAAAGADEVILAVGYQPREMMEALGVLEKRYHVKITCSIETEPLGTAGPIRLAQSILEASSSEEFFVFNSDVICTFPLTELLAFHRAHGREGTICVTRVSDPSKYGVVVFEEKSGQIERFVEKPNYFISDQINAGLYIMNKKVINRIPPLGNFAMFEKDVFPQMATSGELFCFKMQGYWADIGQPKDYLTGMKLHLNSLASGNSRGPDAPVCAGATGHAGRMVDSGEATRAKYRVIGNVFVHETAVIEENCVLGPDVTIGPNCQIGTGARIKESAILEGSRIGDSTYICGSIIGWRCRVGNFSRIEAMTVLGENVTVMDELFLNGVFVLPHKTQRDSVMEHGKVLM